MIKLKALRAFAVVLLAGVLIGAAADRVLTSTELRSLSPREANRQYQRDLLSILQPMNHYPAGMRRLMGDVWAHTRAVATDYEAFNASVFEGLGVPVTSMVPPAGLHLAALSRRFVTARAIREWTPCTLDGVAWRVNVAWG